MLPDELRVAPAAPEPKPEEKNLLERIPGIGGVLAGAADIPLSAIQGLAGTGKTLTDLFGADNAVSDVLGGIAEGAEGLKSSGSKEDAAISAAEQKAAEDKGVWEQVKAAGRAFGRAPIETTASVLGSAVPFLAAGVAGGIPAAVGLGAVSGIGMIKGDIYDAVQEEFIKAGASPEQANAAAEKAQEYSGENLDMQALGAVLGGLAAGTGLAPAVARRIGGQAAAKAAAKAAAREAAEKAALAGLPAGAAAQVAGKAAPGLARSALTGAAAEAVPEAIQAGQERLAQNLALQREGFDVDTMKGVAGQAAFEGLASLIPGAAGKVYEVRGERAAAKREQEAPPAAPEETAIQQPLLDEFDRLFTAEVASEMQAAPDITKAEAIKRAKVRAEDIAEQARANVEEAQAAGVAGPASGPDVDVAGAAGEGVQDTGVPLPTQEAPEGVPTAEPDGVAGAGVDTGGVAAPEAGAVGALTEEVAPAEPVAAAPEVAPAEPVAVAPEVAPAEPVAVAPEVAPAEPVAAAPEVAPAVDLLAPIKAAPNMAERKKVARPLVSNTVDELVGDVIVPSKVLTNITNVVSQDVAKGLDFDLKTRVGELLAKNGIEIAPAPTMEVPSVAETTAPAAPEVAPSPTEAAAPEAVAAQEITPSPVVQTPAYTYADLTAEADSLVAPNPDMVLPGQLTAQQFQQFTMQADAVAEAAKQGMPVPSPVELRQRLYEVVGREPPPLETPAAPEAEAAPEAAAAPEPAPEAAAPAPAPIGFKTAMGSTYTLDAEGRTTREKAKRGTPGHEGDFGPKATSAKTVYVDSAEQAAALSAAGLQGLTSKGARVAIKDGKATLLTWNSKAGKWGATPSSRDIPVYSEPAVGRAPLELWKPAKDVPGYEAYSKMHAGNQITELMTPAAPVAATPTSAAAEPVAPAAAAPPAAPPGVPPTPPVPPSGAAPQPGGKGPKKPKVAKPFALTAKQLEDARRAAGLKAQKDSAMKAKVARSKDVRALADNTSKMFSESRGFEGPLRLLRTVNDTLAPPIKRAIAYFVLPADDVVRIIGDKVPSVREVADIMNNRLPAYRNAWSKRADVIAREWTAFQAKHAETEVALNEVLKELDFANVAPWTAPNADAYLKAKPTTDPKFAKARAAEVRRAYDEWNKLARMPGGVQAQGIIKKVVQHYKATMEEGYRLERAAIEKQGLDPADERKLISLLNIMYADARAREAYAPAMRNGEYWISIGANTKNPEFHMFESAYERNKVYEELRKTVDPDMLRRGNERRQIESLLTNSATASKLLKEFMATVDGAVTGDGNQSVAETLKDNFMQMYLLSLPEASIRKQFVSRRYVTGFSMDGLRDFYRTQLRAINHLGRLKFSSDLRNRLDEARARAKGIPDGIHIEPYIQSLQAQVDNTLRPPSQDWFTSVVDRMASFGNKFAFLWLLTSPKSMLVTHTQLHMVTLPALNADYGAAKVAAASARYITGILTGQKAAVFHKDANGDVIPTFDPNLRDSKFMQDLKESDPAQFARRYKAWEYGNNRNAFADNFTTSLAEGAAAPTYSRGVKRAFETEGSMAAANEGVRAVTRFMSGGFHHMESMNRQIAYMTTYDLEFDAAKARGLDDKAAQKVAQDKALSLTRETMFNFSTFNKPEAFKQPYLKLSTQFMTFPIMLTSYLVRNSTNMFRALSGEAKVAAGKRLFGTLGMTALYGGITALPMYGMFWIALEAMRDAMTDDGDDPEFAPYADDEGNPLGKVNLKFWFENSYLPSVFGPDSDIAKGLGLSPEASILLTRGIRSGAPAVADADIQSSVSMSDLFFRNDLKADTLQGMFEEATFANLFGPAGSIVTNFGRAAELFERGEGTRAVELMVPAFIKGAVRASRLSEEGLKDIKGREIKPPEFYTATKLFYQSLNIGSAETGEIQRQNTQIREMRQGIEDAKSQLITRLGEAYVRVMEDPSEANIARRDELEAERSDFNRTYTTTPIGDESVTKSVNSILEGRSGAVEGADLEPAIPIGESVLRRRLGE